MTKTIMIVDDSALIRQVAGIAWRSWLPCPHYRIRLIRRYQMGFLTALVEPYRAFVTLAKDW